jgi:hypothetical protein
MRTKGKLKAVRLSKRVLKASLQDRLAALKDQWHFDPDLGWTQAAGRGEECNRAFGEFKALRGFLQQIETGRFSTSN